MFRSRNKQNTDDDATKYESLFTTEINEIQLRTEHT